MGLRLFVAAQLSEPVQQHLLTFVEPRMGADERLRWSPPEQWHLTTAFFGDVAERVVEPLIEELAAAVARSAPFEARLRGAGFFGRPEAARVLWLAVDPGAEELSALSRRTRNAGSRVGADPDGAAFTAHLTLARARQRFEVGRWLGILQTYSGPVFEISELLLFSSRLHSTGARHEVLARLPLAGHGTGATGSTH
ncbi:RNA 2',3'-cyclic phosphodiesterase [Naumannella halotolerans]|uniref:RNA 2',3'-cyclic phosphodiesterase n=1 Tax=Naumannella halotolerans TaxID=993414 RepID=A0A4R7JA33_9ACTN|nr:RNA 2',3'-cyclic phosphodiesterase [Naumannella halotolerans]TDT33393.1 2'-5' RNA ligase [Naumannella halotolerans]